jgi:hypothetical protein
MADMADEAVGPDGEADTACERAFVIPETGSDLELGHKPRGGFFFEDHVLDSPLVLCPALLCCEAADTVEADEDESKEEEEFDLWILFRGINIRDTSSAFIEVRVGWPPLPPAYHPRRGPDCTLGGEATAVMRKKIPRRMLSGFVQPQLMFYSTTSQRLLASASVNSAIR